MTCDILLSWLSSCVELLDLTGIKEILARTKADTVSRIASRRKIFFNRPLVIARSAKGESEIRYAALGKTYGSRLINGSVYPARQQDSRDQRAAHEQKRKETL